MRSVRALLLAVFALGLCWLSAEPAAAALGDLDYRGCLADDDGIGACDPLPGAPLDGASAIALSPDGASLYAVGERSNALSRFVAGPNGELAYRDCQASSEPVRACLDLPGDPLRRPRALAVSPDGGALYVGSGSPSNAVSHFFRGGDGAFAFGGCLAATATPGCGAQPGPALDGPRDAVVSPDGGWLYVASFSSNAVLAFERAPGGQLFYSACYANTAAHGCVDLPGAPLEGVTGLALSPDGGALYAVGRGGDSIARFQRQPTGQLGFRECLADSAAGGCSVLAGFRLDGADALAIDPAGENLYVVARLSASIVAFDLSPVDGALAFRSCLTGGTKAVGCGPLPHGGLTEVGDVAISPDGRSVYTANAGGLLFHFGRDPDEGSLSLSGCLTGAKGPANEPFPCTTLPGSPLIEARAVVVSPDGSSVFVAAGASDAIARFARSTSDTPPPPNQPRQDPPPQQDPPPVRCQGKVATIVGSAAGEVLRGTPGRDVIAGLGGGDVIHGRGGADLICGGAGADRLFGGAGADRLDGGPGADRLNGGAGADRLLGGPGRDRCEGGPGRDVVRCELGSGR